MLNEFSHSQPVFEVYNIVFCLLESAKECHISDRGYKYPSQELDPRVGHSELELRVRFRVPTAKKLLKIDPMTFNYLYKQTLADFQSGEALAVETLQPRDPALARFVRKRFSF